MTAKSMDIAMKHCALVSLVILALASGLAAQDDLGRSRITGDVVDESGAKVQGALVLVGSLRSRARFETRTDKKGRFAVGGLGSGVWQVTASKEGYLSAAEVALKSGDFGAAQGYFRRALEISPEDPAAAYNVGEIFFSNQKIDDAVAYFELAIKIKSDWPKAYHRLGLVYLNKGDFPKALENLKKFLELDPQNPEAANVKAMIATIEQIKK
jgi:tetratricopeptide (TPR) repeat protein